MQLIPCNRPVGPLETAPRTSLRADTAHERWDGFWCVADERYYAQCVRDDGSEQWYRIADVARAAARETRVIPLRPRNTSHVGRQTYYVKRESKARTWLLLSARPGGRPILVGSYRRGSRPRDETGVVR